MGKKTVFLLSITLIFIGFLASCKKKHILGCKDPNSLNYNKSATKDDGSCQIIDNAQRYFVLEIGATHCAPCGSYAIPSLQKALETIGTHKMVGIAVHVGGDPLECAAGRELADYTPYYSISIPRFAGGSKTIMVGVYPDLQTNVDKIKKEADAYTGLQPVVNCYVGKSINGDSATLNLTAKFFNSGEGEYYLSAYILEDGIVAPQLMRNGFTDSIKKDMVHNHVMRGAFGPTFGTPLIKGAVTKGTMVTKSLTTKLNANWKKENLHFAVVIWKKDSLGIYKFENCTEI